MKTILFLLLSASSALAAPFLVCNSVPSPAAGQSDARPTSYTITGIGTTAITTPATINPDTSAQLHFDLATTPNGTYTVTATATNSAGTSAASASTTFTLPLSVTPAVPANLHVSPQ